MERTGRDAVWPVAAAMALVALAVVWGRYLSPHTLQLDAPPFVGQWDVRLGARAALPVFVGLASWALCPALLRLPWRRLLAGAWLMAIAWAGALAAVDGVHGFTTPLLLKDDYLHDVPRVGSGFLSTFTDHIVSGSDRWTTHVGGHPPGLLLLLKGLDSIGLGGAWPAVVLFVAAGTSAVLAVLVTVRRLAGEDSARRAAPFLALAPAAVWVAVSADAFFLGVTAWGLALCALRRPVAAGLVLGLSLFLTYGALPLGLVALVLLKSWQAVLRAAAGVLVVVVAFLLAGFWWVDGLQQTLVRVQAGAGGYRPLEYFVVANVAVLVVALGPAALAGLRRLTRPDPLWLLVAPVLVGLVIADVSGTSRGEVERVWLPYVPWLLVATARLSHPRGWLAAQLATGLAIQLTLRSKW